MKENLIDKEKENIVLFSQAAVLSNIVNVASSVMHTLMKTEKEEPLGATLSKSVLTEMVGQEVLNQINQ